jgi:hypothetical protein
MTFCCSRLSPICGARGKDKKKIRALNRKEPHEMATKKRVAKKAAKPSTKKKAAKRKPAKKSTKKRAAKGPAKKSTKQRAKRSSSKTAAAAPAATPTGM